jgi:hypothetical protein
MSGCVKLPAAELNISKTKILKYEIIPHAAERYQSSAVSVLLMIGLHKGKMLPKKSYELW